jgi:hypothetical protein
MAMRDEVSAPETPTNSVALLLGEETEVNFTYKSKCAVNDDSGGWVISGP